MPTENKKAEVEKVKKTKKLNLRSNKRRDKKKSKPKVEAKQKFWLGTYLLLLLGLGAVYYSLRLEFFSFATVYFPLLQRLTLGAMTIVLVLMIAGAVKAYLIDSLDDNVARYNLKRVVNLLVGIAIFFIVALDSFRQLVHGGRFARPDLADCRLCAANADHELYRLDLHSRASAVSRRRPHQDRRRDRRRDRRQLSRHDALGIWRPVSFDRSSERPNHQISQLERARLVRLQLFVAAFSLHLERDQISDRLSKRSGIRRRSDAESGGRRGRRSDDGARPHLPRTARANAGRSARSQEHPAVSFASARTPGSKRSSAIWSSRSTPDGQNAP